MKRLVCKSTVAWPLLTALLTLIGVLIPHWITPGYYYDDDVRHYFMVSIHDIGTALQQGNWPLLSLRSAYSGDLVGEGQFGLFNPVTLFLYIIVSRISDLGLGALFYAGFHLIAMALSVYALARRLAIEAPWAALAGVAYALGGMNSYWYATSWWNALTANTWLIWALVCWLSVFRQRCYFLLTMLCTAAVFMGGWPHGSVALSLTASIFAIYYASRSRSMAPLQDLAVIGLCALLVSLLALVPLALHVLESDRAQSSIFHNGIMSATLENLLSISWPSHFMAWPHFFGKRPEQPHYYAAWFILPLLVLNANKLADLWRDKKNEIVLLLGLSALFALLSLGPEQIGPLRWPFRFVPYFQLFLLLASLKLACHTDFPRNAPAPLSLLCLIGFIICWQQTPNELSFHLSFSLLCFIGAWTSFASKSPVLRSVILLGVTLLISAVTHFEWPINGNVGHWPSPLLGKIQAELPVETGRVLILQPQPRDATDSWQQLPSGNIGLWENRPFINGYSPIQQNGLKQAFCFNTWSWSCNQAVEKLLAKDKTTGVDLATLLRIDEVRAASGALSISMAKLAPISGFERLAETPYHTVWHRHITRLPGTVSWITPELHIGTNSQTSVAEERFQIDNVSSQPAQIIWARIAYPGYRATLNGRAIPLHSYRGLLVSTNISPGESGELVLSHHLPGLPWTPLAALVGIIVVSVYEYRFHRSRLRNA